MIGRAILLPLVLGAALTACNPALAPSPALLETRDQMRLHQSNPRLAEAAPTLLHDAEQNLQLALRAQRQGNAALAQHHTYMARRQLEIARAKGEQRAAIDRRRDLARELDSLALRGDPPTRSR